MKKTVSIIIPSFNSSRTINITIDRIFASEEKIKEVIIADSSVDQEHDLLIKSQEHYEKLKVKRLDYRTIPAIARNKGAEEATGDILVFIDSDAYPADDWLDKILDAYSQGKKVGGGSICIPEFQLDKKIAIAQYYLQFNEYLPVGEERKKTFAPSCNLYCERDLFYNIGGFPDIRASEDVLFGMEANKYEPFWFIPACKVYHIFGESGDRLKRNQKVLGKYVGIYRKKKNSGLKYSIPVQICLFPFIPLIKYVLLYSRVRKAGEEFRRQLMKGTGIIFAGLWYWALGYMSGIFDRDE